MYRGFIRVKTAKWLDILLSCNVVSCWSIDTFLLDHVTFLQITGTYGLLAVTPALPFCFRALSALHGGLRRLSPVHLVQDLSRCWMVVCNPQT